jgi:hypothetical protein
LHEIHRLVVVSCGDLSHPQRSTFNLREKSIERLGLIQDCDPPAQASAAGLNCDRWGFRTQHDAWFECSWHTDDRQATIRNARAAVRLTGWFVMSGRNSLRLD